jgi:hypothetical protein
MVIPKTLDQTLCGSLRMQNVSSWLTKSMLLLCGPNIHWCYCYCCCSWWLCCCVEASVRFRWSLLVLRPLLDRSGGRLLNFVSTRISGRRDERSKKKIIIRMYMTDEVNESQWNPVVETTSGEGFLCPKTKEKNKQPSLKNAQFQMPLRRMRLPISKLRLPVSLGYHSSLWDK